MNIYKQAFSLGLQKAMNYRVNFYIGMLGIIFPLFIRYFLWTSIFSSGNNEAYFGYTLPQMLSYSVFSIITAKVISAGFIYEVNFDIKSGGLAKYLVRPMRYMPYQAFCYIGDKCVIIVLTSIMIITVSVVVNTIWSSTITIQNVSLYFLTLISGTVLNFIIYYSICGIGFWMREATGAIYTITVMGSIVSGGLFPLDIFNGKIQFILKMLPFPYTNYFPVSVLCGRTVGDDVYLGIILQFLWIIVILTLQQMIWKKGMKRYTAVGG